MKVKAIVFDKDGTLIDYSAFWYPVSKFAINMIYEKFGVTDNDSDDLIASLGVLRDYTDIKGALPRGAHRELFFKIAEHVAAKGALASEMEIAKFAVYAYGKISKPMGTVKPTCENIRSVISSLKEHGLYIALITSDEIGGARIALEKLGIADLFDEIIAHDGESPAKPDPFYMNRFAENHGFSKSEIVMVGDTSTDIIFAKNSGVYGIGVGESSDNRDYLELLGADITLKNISCIEDHLLRSDML